MWKKTEQFTHKLTYVLAMANLIIDALHKKHRNFFPIQHNFLSSCVIEKPQRPQTTQKLNYLINCVLNKKDTIQ